MLGNHPAQNRTLEKRQWMLDHPGENDFLDPQAWPQFLEAQEERLRAFQLKDY
jgi:metallo-beta-lactamase class B